MAEPLRIRFATDHSAAKSGMQDLAASVVANMIKASDAMNTGIQANGGYAATFKTKSDFENATIGGKPVTDVIDDRAEQRPSEAARSRCWTSAAASAARRGTSPKRLGRAAT